MAPGRRRNPPWTPGAALMAGLGLAWLPAAPAAWASAAAQAAAGPTRPGLQEPIRGERQRTDQASRGGRELAGASEGGSVPASIEELAARAAAAHQDGEGQRAVALQREVVAWAGAHLPELDPFRARALNSLGVFLGGVGMRGEALPALAEAVRIRRALAQTNPAVVGDLARAVSNLGLTTSALGQRAEALPLAREAVALTRQLARTDPAYHADLARALGNLAVAHSDLGQRAEALPPALEAVALWREQARANPADQRQLADALTNLALTCSDLGLSAALPAARETVRIRRQLARANPAELAELARSLTQLGHRYGELGQHAEARPPLEEAVALYLGLLERDPAALPALWRALLGMAELQEPGARAAEAR